jgi:hypothetical protein
MKDADVLKVVKTADAEEDGDSDGNFELKDGWDNIILSDAL